MALIRRTVASLPAVSLATAAVVARQLYRATRRSDLPSFPNQDPSGIFGDRPAPRLRIVAVGDSSLTSPGVEVLDNAWIRLVARRLADRYRVELISLAVGGSKARDVIESQLAEAVRLRPQVAVVSVGANDALRGTNPSRFRRELTSIVERLESAGAAVVVYGMGDLGSITRLPRSIRPLATHRSAVFDRICREVAVAFPRTVKVHTRGWIRTAFHDDPTLFAGDLFHAGDKGHAVFAEGAFPAFEAALALSHQPTS